MADYDINTQDVESSAQLIRDVLLSEKPERDYSEGSVAGDIVVDGHAVPFAVLRNLISKVQARLSLRDLSKLADDEAVRDATDAILSNLFVTRTRGAFARGAVTLHFTQRVDSLIPRRTRFFKTAQYVFYLDSTLDVLITAASLRPNVDASGAVVDYTTTVNIVAANIGVAYNLDAGRFTAVDNISSFLAYAENTSRLQFGLDQQSSADAVATAETAMSLRAMVNARSNNAVLRGVDSSLESVLTVGYGDPEMQRDLAVDPASAVALHVGGHVDIYLRTETQEVVERRTINGLTVRPDGLVSVLRDVNPPLGSFITAGVVPGDVLVLRAIVGVSDVFFEFMVREVLANELTISSRIPFRVATDEFATTPALTYSVGDNYPTFDDKVVRGPTTDATTSRRFKRFNSVCLPGQPVYRVKTVEIIDPISALDPYRDPETGLLLFTERTNGPTLVAPAPGDALPYFLEALNPNYTQTAKAVTALEVGWPGFDFSGMTLEITYETLSGFNTLASYVVDDFQRTCGANPVAKGFHPVYLSTTVTYRARVIPRNASEIWSVAAQPYAVNETAIRDAVLAAINDATQGVVPDAGALATAAQDADSNVAAIYPMTILYELLAPDGKVYQYSTPDVVTLFPNDLTGAKLLNPTEVGLPATDYQVSLARQLTLLGVSDRTVRYLAVADDVVLEKRGV